MIVGRSILNRRTENKFGENNDEIDVLVLLSKTIKSIVKFCNVIWFELKFKILMKETK
jgi:hypothetical protein